MIHILKLFAVIVVITYSLRLVNAQSDLLVFGGLAIICTAVYYSFFEFNKMLNHLKSKL